MTTELPNPRVVLDTNILVSALNFGGKPSSVILLARSGRCSLFLSSFILEETQDVLKEKFSWDAQRAHQASGLLEELATVIKPIERVTTIAEDDSDNRILECALTANADYIISGDRHLLKLKNFRSTQVVTVDEFLNAIQSR